jgi:hypothetical protein
MRGVVIVAATGAIALAIYLRNRRGVDRAFASTAVQFADDSGIVPRCGSHMNRIGGPYRLPITRQPHGSSAAPLTSPSEDEMIAMVSRRFAKGDCKNCVGRGVDMYGKGCGCWRSWGDSPPNRSHVPEPPEHMLARLFSDNNCVQCRGMGVHRQARRYTIDGELDESTHVVCQCWRRNPHEVMRWIEQNGNNNTHV